MAASKDVKLKKGGSVKDILKGDAKQLTQKGDDKKGKLTTKDGSIEIAYEVDGETASLEVIKTDDFFKGYEDQILKGLFG
jgi:hypothetical protein